jgi:hypothetical protein
MPSSIKRLSNEHEYDRICGDVSYQVHGMQPVLSNGELALPGDAKGIEQICERETTFNTGL